MSPNGAAARVLNAADALHKLCNGGKATAGAPLTIGALKAEMRAIRDVLYEVAADLREEERSV